MVRGSEERPRQLVWVLSQGMIRGIFAQVRAGSKPRILEVFQGFVLVLIVVLNQTEVLGTCFFSLSS